MQLNNYLICKDRSSIDDWMKDLWIFAAQNSFPNGESLHVKSIRRGQQVCKVVQRATLNVKVVSLNRRTQIFFDLKKHR